MSDASTHRPIRIGVYDSLANAEQAFTDLQQAGFTEAELSVLCSDEQQRKHFPPAETEGDEQDPSKAAAVGGAIGGLIGGATATLGLSTIAGIPIVVAGALSAALAGGVVGGLSGAMAARGLDSKLADYFDQAVSDGKILIGVEPTDSDEARLAKAAQILKDAGAEPLSLLGS